MKGRKLRFLAPLAALAACATAFLVLTACTGKGSGGQKNPATEAPASPTEDPRVFKDTMDKVQPNPEQHVTMKVEDEGFDIFAPLKGQWGYRYGPSILYYPDGTMDAWFATPGTDGEWDWFTYKHSDDGGKTWSKEKVVLQPTPDSMDHYSVCDPGVVYFGGYYYLGYTSTIVNTNGGINNNVFVARSQNPDGPYEKWNGNGWGGDPQPIVYYDEADGSWGAGEISFVILDDTLYCYYNWACPDGNYVKVSTAPVEENWPASMEYRGTSYVKQTDQDSCDVLYIEDVGKFVAFSTYNRFSPNSGIALFESDDGIHFTKADVIRTGVAQYCHNMGVSKRPDGHVQLKDPFTIGYGYSDGASDNWGKWATRFQHASIQVYEGELATSKGKGTLLRDYFWTAPDEPWAIAISTMPHKIEVNIGEGTYPIDARWYDTTLKSHRIQDASKVTFTDYDTNVVEFDGLTAQLKGVGKTTVTMHYEGLQITFKIYVRPDDFTIGQKTPAIREFRPVNDDITVYLKDEGKRHGIQIRGFVIFEDETWGEAYNDSTAAHPTYPPMVPKEDYKMEFKVENTDIIRVSQNGVISPRAVGTTTVQVTITGGLSFTVRVTVVESRF